MTGKQHLEQDGFDTALSAQIWETKYRYPDTDADIADTWRRVAGALAAVEPQDQAQWAGRFYALLEDFRFLPGGRILAGAGTAHHVTLFNCFVMGRLEDDMGRIFDSLKEAALTLQQGGGIGCDYSNLRPRGTPARRTGTIASGPVSFMHIWDAMCATLLSTGARRGAMMATLRCDHPDIEDFIAAKAERGVLRHFNLSVLVSDAFMAAVHDDTDWPLVFPAAGLDGESECLTRDWDGEPTLCRVMRRVRARELWARIMRETYAHAEPGVLFIDRINRLNNLHAREYISGTNPCGEIPLPTYGACNLGAVNLTRFVRAPFTAQAHMDFAALAETAAVATRLLDNVTDASGFPLPAQQAQAQATRRIGLGLTGLGDALIMLGLHYDSDAARESAARIMRTLCHSAYRASIALAREKGAFARFDAQSFLDAPFIRALPEDIRHDIAYYGIRNSHLTAIAPTGTISLLANTVSSGLEPVFAARYQRRVREADGRSASHVIEGAAVRQWRRLRFARVQAEPAYSDVHGDQPDIDDETALASSLPPAFVTAAQLSPQAHLAMQAALQPYVDNAISKTVIVPEDFPFAEFQDLYRQAYDLGLKGCTTFRPNPVTGEVLGEDLSGSQARHCCHIEREAD